MSVDQISQGDFKYLTGYGDAMRTCFDKEFLKKADPELMKLMYRGKNARDGRENDGLDRPEEAENPRHYMALSRLFTATNTILPNSYWKNPRAIVIGKRGASVTSAAILSAALNYYRAVNRSKEQNQEAIMNAWFFGLGWKKLGYRTVLQPSDAIAQEPETITQKLMSGIQGMVGGMMGQEPNQPKPDDLQSGERPEFVDYETLFNDSESPMNVMLDHKASLMNCRAIRHTIKRSLYELQNFSGSYEPETLQKIETKFKYSQGSRLDSRNVELTLNELHIWQRNGIWILTYIDEFKEPLRYEKQDADIQGFCFEPLRFDNEPGVRYPVAHMKVAAQVQTKLDDMATLFLEIVGKVRNQLILNQSALAPGQLNAIKKNEIGGVILTNGPISASTYAQLQSASVQNDIPMLMSLVQQNIVEITGSDPQMITGQSKNDTLGQDELARVGTSVRESGMVDRIRDWEIKQLKKEGCLLKQYSAAKLALEVTKQDFVDKQQAKDFQDTFVEFMTMANPLGMKSYLEGEFDYDMNMYEAKRPDKKGIQEECATAITLLSNPQVQQAMMMNGAKPRIDILAEKAIDQLEFVKGADCIEHLDPMQAAAYMAQAVMMQSGGQVPGSITPQDKLKAAGQADANASKESISGNKVTQPSAKGGE